jgi:hypothetical protein
MKEVWLAIWNHDEGFDVEVYSTEAAALDAADRMQIDAANGFILDGNADVIKKEIKK